MQKLFLIALLGLSTGVFAQGTAKKTTTTAKKPAAPVQYTMKNSIDSFSYAVGLSIANFYKEQGITNINTNLVIKAINDARINKPKLSEAEINTCIMNVIQKSKEEKSGPNRKASEAFLEKNKTQPGIITTASGLQYQVITMGTGPKPVTTDQVKVHYSGFLIDGTPFESSVGREPVVFGLTNVISGWVEALQMMPVGSKWRLFLPPNLAYGDNPPGPPIQPGSALIFEVELLEIVKNN
jgi:FKBP-type peptidyl-prolyl cis-trans isomerase FklB